MYKCYLRRIKCAGSFYLHGSNLRVRKRKVSELQQATKARQHITFLELQNLQIFSLICVRACAKTLPSLYPNECALVSLYWWWVKKVLLFFRFKWCGVHVRIPWEDPYLLFWSSFDMPAGIFLQSGLRANCDSWVFKLCCTDNDRRLLFVIFSVAGSSGCIRAHWGLPLDRYKREIYEAFFSCAVRLAVVLITEILYKYLCESPWRQVQMAPLPFLLYVYMASPPQRHWEYGTYVARRSQGDLRISYSQVHTTDRTEGNLWKADTVEL